MRNLIIFSMAMCFLNISVTTSVDNSSLSGIKVADNPLEEPDLASNKLVRHHGDSPRGIVAHHGNGPRNVKTKATIVTPKFRTTC